MQKKVDLQQKINIWDNFHSEAVLDKKKGGQNPDLGQERKRLGQNIRNPREIKIKPTEDRNLPEKNSAKVYGAQFAKGKKG